VVILTDHSNLQYCRHPQKISRCVARYISFLEDFNYQLKHIPGIQNHADALSRWPDHDNSIGDNEQVTTLPDDVFVRAVSTAALDKSLRRQLSPPRPGTNWADWSDAMGREMYLRRALDRLNFEYPSDDAT
jgi:hypothetical protein